MTIEQRTIQTEQQTIQTEQRTKQTQTVRPTKSLIHSINEKIRLPLPFMLIVILSFSYFIRCIYVFGIRQMTRNESFSTKLVLVPVQVQN